MMQNLLKRLKTSRYSSLSSAWRRPTHTGRYLRQRESARGLSGKLSLTAALADYRSTRPLTESSHSSGSITHQSLFSRSSSFLTHDLREIPEPRQRPFICVHGENHITE